MFSLSAVIRALWTVATRASTLPYKVSRNPLQQPCCFLSGLEISPGVRQASAPALSLSLCLKQKPMDQPQQLFQALQIKLYRETRCESFFFLSFLHLKTKTRVEIIRVRKSDPPRQLCVKRGGFFTHASSLYQCVFAACEDRQICRLCVGGLFFLYPLPAAAAKSAHSGHEAAASRLRTRHPGDKNRLQGFSRANTYGSVKFIRADFVLNSASEVIYRALFYIYTHTHSHMHTRIHTLPPPRRVARTRLHR